MWSTGQFASPWPSGLVTDRGRPFTCASVIYTDVLIRHSVRSPFLRKKRLRGGSCSCLEGSQPATRNKFLLRPHCFPCPATYAGGTAAVHCPMSFPTPHTSSFWDQQLCLRDSEQQRALVETPKGLWEPCHWALLSLELQFDTRNCHSLQKYCVCECSPTGRTTRYKCQTSFSEPSI